VETATRFGEARVISYGDEGAERFEPVHAAFAIIIKKRNNELRIISIIAPTRYC
jgi:hypothetical protein